MRAYAALSTAELKDFFESNSYEVAQLYAATEGFLRESSGQDEEEVEFTLSLLAAEDAIEDQEVGSGRACVVACEIPKTQIATSDSMLITLNSALSREQVEAVFLVSDDGEELTWFAPQEVAVHLDEWMR